MEVKNIKKVMAYGEKVKFKGRSYILTGCILRFEENDFYYQVELKDLKADSITICRLEDIKVE